MRLVLSRRSFLAGVGLSGVAAFLAACGTSPSPSPSDSAPSASTPAVSSAPASATPGSSASAGPSATPSGPPPSIKPSPSPVDELARRIAGLLIVGFRGERLADAAWVKTAIRRDGLGGVILFDRDQLTGRARNIASPGQVATLTHDLRAAAGVNGLIIGVDQEGGIVTRLGPTHGFPALASQAEEHLAQRYSPPECLPGCPPPVGAHTCEGFQELDPPIRGGGVSTAFPLTCRFSGPTDGR